MKHYFLFSFFISIVIGTTFLHSQNKAPGVYKKYNPAVVKILTYHSDNSPCGQGSGVVLKQYGWIVTNYHVLGDAPRLSCAHNGKHYRLDSIIAYDSKKDILVMKIAPDLEKNINEKIPVMKIAGRKELIIGEEVFALGSPLGFENTITNGLFNGVRSSTDSSQNFIQISAPLSPGSSGGAVFNAKGKLIGISSLVMSGNATQNINFAILIEDVIETANKKIKFMENNYNNSQGNNKAEHKQTNSFTEGYTYYLQGYYLPAIYALQNSLNNESTDIERAYYLIGESYRNLEMYDSATWFLNKSLAEKKYAHTWSALSKIAWARRDTLCALSNLDSALNLEPLNADAAIFKSEILFYRGDYSGVLSLLDNIFSTYLTDPRISSLLGYISLRMKKYNLAEQEFKYALKLNPYFALAQLGLSKVLKWQKKFDLAVQWENAALETEPQLKDSYFFGVE